MNIVFNQVESIIKNSIGLFDQSLKPDISLSDLGIDSFEKAEILIQLKRAFKLNCSLSEFQSLEKLSDVYDRVYDSIQSN